MRKEDILNSKRLIKFLLSADANDIILSKNDYASCKNAKNKGFLEKVGNGVYKLNQKGKEFIETYHQLFQVHQAKKAKKEQEWEDKINARKNQRDYLSGWEHYESQSTGYKLHAKFIPY